MFEILVLLFFLVLPFYVGYSWATKTAFLLPLALFCGSVLSYTSNGSSGGQPDEVDVIPVIYLVASVAGLLLCALGIALGRQRQDTGS